MATGNEIWKSTATAAEMMGVTARAIYGFINKGQLPAYRFGRVIRVKTKDIEAFIEENRIGAGDLSHLFHEDPDEVF